MSITLTGTGGLFTRVGLMAAILNKINNGIGADVVNRVNLIAAQYQTTDQGIIDGLYTSMQAYQLVPQAWLTYLSQLANTTVIQMAQDSAPLAYGNIQEAMTVLIAQMKSQSVTVKPNTPSVSVSTGSNTGDGVVAASVVAADGLNLEYIFAENMKAIVTADSYSGGTVSGSETVTVTGVLGVPTQPLNWQFGAVGYGSNANVQLTAVDATTNQNSTGNLLNNSDFESWGAINANLPNNWVVGAAGVAGTDILKDNNPYSGSYNLKFLGDGSTLSSVRQQFNSAAGTTSVLSSRQVLGVCLRTEIGSSAPAAGVLQISLVNGSGTIITNDAGNNCAFTINLTAETTAYAAHTGWFELPSVLPSSVYIQVALSTALSSAKYVRIDHLACAVAQQMYNSTSAATVANNQNIAGGPYVCVFSGATPFVVNDNFTVDVGNDYGGNFEMCFWKFFNMPAMGLRLNTLASSYTVMESLANPAVAMTTYLNVAEYNIPPSSLTVGSYATTPIDLRLHPTLLFMVQGGALGSSGTIDAQVQYSPTSGGSYTQVTGSAITTITANNKIATIEIDQAKIPAGNYFVKLVLAVGTATSEAGVTTLVSDNSGNVAAVAQQLNLVV